MQIYFHSCLCSYLSRVPILVEDTVYIFDVCKAKIYMEFQVHRPRQQKVHPVCFHYFTKVQCFVVIVSAHK